MKTKLLRRTYAEEPRYKYCIDFNGANPDMHPVFLMRLGALARAISEKVFLTSAIGGLRSMKQQVIAYHNYKEHGSNLAAVPGTSWHGFGVAADIGNLKVRQMTDEDLKPFGLCKPVSGEDWHIQPVETMEHAKTASFQAQFYNDYHRLIKYKAVAAKVKCPRCGKTI